MKRNPSARAASPTNTAFSGISNYRTDSYRPLRAQSKPPSQPRVDPRFIAKVHYEEMSSYLTNHLAREPANARASAREKLTRLTEQQFQELSTDVYDELMRRKNNTENEEVPFLPVRDDFHPKRNLARQKLATLPKTRFKDLSGDVFYELSRRYPEFKEPEALPGSPNSNYDDMDVPSPDFPTASPRGMKSTTPLTSMMTDSGYGSTGRRSGEETYRRDFSGREDGYSPSANSRRKPSQADVVATLRNEERRRASPDYGPGRRSEENDRDRDLGRKPSASASTTSDSTASAANAQREMIIPNKSIITEEDIEVPYARERESGSTAIDGRRSRSPDIRDRNRSPDRRRDTDLDALTDELDSARSPQMAVGGLSALSARLGTRGVQDEDEEEEGWSGTNRSGDEYFDKMSFGRASVASDRSVGAVNTPRAASNTRTSRSGAGTADAEELRREYEFKIATMQSKMTSLERDLENAGERERRLREAAAEDKVAALEEELRRLREKTEQQSATIMSLTRELEELREENSREKERATRRDQEDSEELQLLRDQCERLERERAGGNKVDEDVEQLRSDLEGLMSELADLSLRNDELMNAKDSDHNIIQNLDAQVKEYKRKYEAAKTELRSVKATSQLFLQAPKMDTEQLPVSANGGLLDIHVTAFLTGMDNLLTAGRSPAPTRVLTPMKAIVNAVTAIVDDVRAYERRRDGSRIDVDPEVLQALRERAEATLTNLVTASKTHATSLGMSPVSLLDAAASHLSVTITEIGKTIFIRKATKAEQDQFSPPPSTPGSTATNGFTPTLKSVEELKASALPSHSRYGSSSSTRRSEDYNGTPSGGNKFMDLRTSSPTKFTSGRSSTEDARRRAPSPSSSHASTPPPIFDHSAGGGMNGGVSDDSAAAEGPDDAWAELKPYLEAQSAAIVYAIQAVLSGVRSPQPSPNLNENLTQIITIVSSIVAVCKDSIPTGSALEGEAILEELSEQANRLSEVQAQRELTKESRQLMAKSSFAVANAMKGLMKL